MPQTKKLSEVRGKALKDPEVKKLWDSSTERRALGAALAMLRSEKGLSQTDIALRAGWDNAYVSRLESSQGGVPETQTLARYINACGATMALAVIDEGSGSGQLRVLSTFSSEPLERPASEMSQ